MIQIGNGTTLKGPNMAKSSTVLGELFHEKIKGINTRAVRVEQLKLSQSDKRWALY